MRKKKSSILVAVEVRRDQPHAVRLLRHPLGELGRAAQLVQAPVRALGALRVVLRAARREGLEARRATRERRDAGELGSSVTETYVLWLAKG